MLPSLASNNPIVVQFSQQPLHVCRRFLFCFGNCRPFSAYCSLVRQPHDAGTNTYPLLYIPFLFQKNDTREDANIHKAIACKYLSNSFHGCRRMIPGLLLPRILLFLDTLRPRDIDGSEGVAAVGSGFCARSLLSRRKLHRFPFEQWPFSFHW